MIKIIWTDATDEQFQQDYNALLKAHKRAMKEDLTWSMFGGTITINGHRYQVVEEKR